jgi:hypothetical protein
MRSLGRTPAPARVATLALAASALVFCTAPRGLRAADDPPPPRTPLDRAVATVTAGDLRSALTFLAGDGLQGRATGHAGSELAARYLAAMLGAAEAQPLAGSSLLQSIDLITPAIGPDSHLTIKEQVRGADVTARFTYGEHLHPAAVSPSREVTAPVVFAGYGISAPAMNYDDYAGLDVSGRIVVVFDRTPTTGQTPDAFGNSTDEHGSLLVKARLAHARGAVGLLVVAPNGNRRLRSVGRTSTTVPSPRERSFDLASNQLPIPVARISGQAATAALGLDARKTDLDALRDRLVKAAKSDTRPAAAAVASFAATNRVATLSTDVDQRPVAAYNVIGLVPGADPVLSKEVIVVGAHFDHDGMDDEGRIYNGADDNGSGTVGVLEVAEAVSRLIEAGERPRRSIVFALWNGEERGLLGSRAFAASTLPGGRTVVANLNMDMIGRDLEVPEDDDRFTGFAPTRPGQHTNTVMVLGYSRAPGLAQLARDENRAIGLSLMVEGDTHAQNLLRRSDQWPFLQRRIPALFFTTGLHPDYHTPDDDVQKINFAKMEKIVRLVTRMTWHLATAAAVPPFTDPAPESAAK